MQNLISIFTGEMNEMIIKKSHIEKALADSNNKLIKEETTNKESEKKILRLEKNMENYQLLNNEKELDYKRNIAELKSELLLSTQTIHTNEIIRKDDIDKNEIQLRNMNIICQEREAWREAVSTKVICPSLLFIPLLLLFTLLFLFHFFYFK